jgi:hypothetical protein
VMVPKKLILLLPTLGLILLGCAPATTQPSPTTAAPGAPTEEVIPTEPAPDEVGEPGFNLLVATEGEVLLKRAKWSDYHPTAFGAALERGDLLRLADGAQAKVLCDNLTLWPVPGGAPSGVNSGCPQPPEPGLMRAGVKMGSTRGVDPWVPYVISPRATTLLNDKPVLRWNDTGADSYTVQVRGGDLNWLQEDVTQTELVYPREPVLEPGTFYLLVVEDSEGKSSQDEGLRGLGFSLLEEAEAERIHADENRIAELGLSSEAEAFAIAQLYAGNGLIAEAIDILEGLVEEGSQQAAVHQALADLYASIGLNLQAEPRYLEAIQMAEAEGNVESQAAIKASLGEVYVKLNNMDEAVSWLTEAGSGYEMLGDTGRADEIAEYLEDSRQ